MKRYKKKEIIEGVNTLEKANNFLSENIDRTSLENIIDTLLQCQEMAVYLGNYLEASGEETAAMVRILEEYCENVYQMSLVLSDDNQCRKISKRIQKQLTQLKNGICYELPADKKEILFLPYKVSMWDSLESIWRAADADESCEAYVVPIPYFNKNPDGTLGQIHYEGNKFPKDVPITSWEEYDIKKRKPDVIYFHNPYDETNYVTSVHPWFYAKELKMYTDKLIYIPYFISLNNKVEEELCILPGIIYADRVIVQSKEVRNTYIRVIRNFEKENACEGLFGNIEEKIVALGSPKYDKVLNTKKEDLIIPQEWKKIITMADGKEKKIVLYNTSVAELLNNSEKMIEKIEDVLRIFKERQEKIALLWRPHPLIPATLQSMRPQLWEQYLKIVTNYCKEKWGIYDDSGELERAIVLSDAYYGAGGSLPALYQVTRKPVMLQDVELIE